MRQHSESCGGHRQGKNRQGWCEAWSVTPDLEKELLFAASVQSHSACTRDRAVGGERRHIALARVCQACANGMRRPATLDKAEYRPHAFLRANGIPP